MRIVWCLCTDTLSVLVHSCEKASDFFQESVCLPRNAYAGAWQSHFPQCQHLLCQACGITAVPRVHVVAGPVLELLPPSVRFSNAQLTDRALQQLGKSKWATTMWLRQLGCSACKAHSAEPSTAGSSRCLVCYVVK